MDTHIQTKETSEILSNTHQGRKLTEYLYTGDINLDEIQRVLSEEIPSEERDPVIRRWIIFLARGYDGSDKEYIDYIMDNARKVIHLDSLSREDASIVTLLLVAELSSENQWLEAENEYQGMESRSSAAEAIFLEAAYLMKTRRYDAAIKSLDSINNASENVLQNAEAARMIIERQAQGEEVPFRPPMVFGCESYFELLDRLGIKYTPNRCIICGKTIKGFVCEDCLNTVGSEKFAIKISSYSPVNEDELLDQAAGTFRNVSTFQKTANEFIDRIDHPRKEFITLYCAAIRASNPGISSYYRPTLVEDHDMLLESNEIKPKEKNLIDALLLNYHEYCQKWEKAEAIAGEMVIQKEFLETYLVLAQYFYKTRRYDDAKRMITGASEVSDSVREENKIEPVKEEIRVRSEGIKAGYKPGKKEQRFEYYSFLKTYDLPVDQREYAKFMKNYTSPVTRVSQKIKESEFKPLTYYEGESVPENYISLWLTSEFHIKTREIVEISAVRVQEGEIIGAFHSFVQPTDTVSSFVNVNIEDVKKAGSLPKVFKSFMEFAGSDVIAVMNFGEQKKLISRAARYSMMDHLDNEFLDIIDFAEELSDTFELYTTETLLEKYDLSDVSDGQKKVRLNVELLNRMVE